MSVYESDLCTRTPEELAMIIQNSPDARERDDAAGKLSAVIQKKAGQLVRRENNRQLRGDFVEEAPSYFWEKNGLIASYSAEMGSFEGWCYRVLENKLRDMLKSPRIRERTNSQDMLAFITPITDSTVEMETVWRMDLATPFSDTDLAMLEGWPARCRLVLLTMQARVPLWKCVPAQRWANWVDVAQAPGGFPPESFTEMNRTQKADFLAVTFRIARNSVYQMLKRCQAQYGAELARLEAGRLPGRLS